MSNTYIAKSGGTDSNLPVAVAVQASAPQYPQQQNNYPGAAPQQPNVNPMAGYPGAQQQNVGYPGHSYTQQGYPAPYPGQQVPVQYQVVQGNANFQQPVYYGQAHGPPGQAPVAVMGQGGYADMGTCRSCGVTFYRPPGVHNASAYFYNCERCARPHASDFCSVQ
jgi:hypothetical protein